MSGGSYRRLRQMACVRTGFRETSKKKLKSFFGEGEGAAVVSEGLKACNENFSTDAEEEFWLEAEEDGLERGGSTPIRGNGTGRGCAG